LAEATLLREESLPLEEVMGLLLRWMMREEQPWLKEAELQLWLKTRELQLRLELEMREQLELWLKMRELPELPSTEQTKEPMWYWGAKAADRSRLLR
jgi:hypothetical protein